jgi:RNA polymerase sigma-70 factor (ECF subfamily)
VSDHDPATPTGTGVPPIADPAVDPIDRAFDAVCGGDQAAFAAWLRLVELPLRDRLRSFAQAVDVEAVLQEGLLRMWQLAPRVRLEGHQASLRYAARLTRNLALMEARRLGRMDRVDSERLAALPELRVDPPPPPDPGLRRLIERCLDTLPRRPGEALRARIREGAWSPDRELAAALRMKLNTFLQNIVRARRLMADCLERHGVAREEWNA